MRNFLTHDYRGADLKMVFDVVKVELLKLSAAFIAFLHFVPKHEVVAALLNEYYQSLQKIVFTDK